MENSNCVTHAHRLIEGMIEEGISHIEIYIALFSASHAIGSLIYADKCCEIMKKHLDEMGK